MIKLLHLSKFIQFSILFTLLVFDAVFASTAINIWEKKENQEEQNNQTNDEKDITIESPILSDDVNKIVVEVEETKITEERESVIGIFDPEENNFNLNMWKKTDGEEIKKTLNRINKLKLSKLSEDLLFQVLFTNSYAPLKNLNSKEFLKLFFLKPYFFNAYMIALAAPPCPIIIACFFLKPTLFFIFFIDFK